MRISKYQAQQFRSQRKKAGEGRGRFVFENNTRADLQLPGRMSTLRYDTVKQKGDQFEGSDYYLQFVPQMLKIIQTLEPPQSSTIQEQNQMDKLIVEQPPQVEEQGQVEFVKDKKKKQLNETPQPQEEDFLLNETPLDDGIEII